MRATPDLAHRAGPAFAAAVLTVALALTLFPPIAGSVSAVDASLDPSPVPSASPSPGPSPTAAPDPAANPGPGASPTPDPGASPIPDPGLASTPNPGASPSPTPRPPGVVDGGGGTVTSGAIALQFPAGAVATPMIVTIAPPATLPDFEGSAPLAGFTVEARDLATGSPVDAFVVPATLGVAPDAWGGSGSAPAGLRIARLVDGAWSVLTTGIAADALTAAIEGPGTFAVVRPVLPVPVPVTFDQTSSAPAGGRGRIDPGSELSITIGVAPATALESGRLVERLPPGWAVVDAGGGSYDAVAATVAWPLGGSPAGKRLQRTLLVRAPSVPLADGGYAFWATFSARLEQADAVKDGPDLVVFVAPRLVADHFTFGQVDPSSLEVRYLALDAFLVGEERFAVFRLRFRVRNADEVPVTWTPQLEFRPADAGAFAVVPAGRNAAGVPFYTAPEWVASRGPYGGTVLGPASEAIEPGDLLGRAAAVAGEVAVAGSHAMGLNPLPAMELLPRSWTEVEFSVRATVDAAYLAAYDFRLTDAGAVFPGAVLGRVRLAAEPKVELTPGQLSGIPADPAQASAGVGDIHYQLVPPSGVVAAGGGAGGAYVLASVAAGAERYPLFAPAASAIPIRTSAPTFGSPHGSYSLTTDACVACHRSHSAGGGNLLVRPAAQASVCFTCHDGSAAATNVQAQYASPTVPANDPSSAAYYRHDALTPSSHTQAQLNEWQDASRVPILNRHSECGDCHDAHAANGAPAIIGPSGWSAPGPLKGISGVSVQNHGAGTAPTYNSWTSAETAYPIEREYELCLKCHSGFTKLPDQVGKPSTWALDKGLEFNPDNGSLHPVEAAGTNGTAAMANSLAGTSPYKQWNFLVGDTVRCVNCHGDPAKFNALSPPSAAADLAPHASQYRGIQLQNYRDRLLKSSAEDYAAGDFALCYLCHAEAPFADVSGNPRADTNFQYHGLHVARLALKGSGGTDIDTAGAGQGNAICSECHFRIHSTALAVDAADRGNSRLVNFAPDVSASATPWTPTAVAAGSCALTCHGRTHDPQTYGPGPAALVLAKTPSPTTFSAAGQTIAFSYVITNVSSATVTGPIVVTDDTIATVTCPTADLPRGASMTCFASYTVSSADMTAGSVTNTAHASSAGGSSNSITTTIRKVP